MSFHIDFYKLLHEVLGILLYILKEVIQGVFFYLIVHKVVKELKKTERALAIRHHYHARSQHKGHEHKSVLVCNEGKCALF